MTAAEWIELLSQYPPDTRVMVRDPGCGCCSSGDLDDLEVDDDSGGVLVVR